MTLTAAITEAGTSDMRMLSPGESADYAVAGTYTGFVNIEVSRNPNAFWETLVAGAEDAEYSGHLANESRQNLWYRFRGIDTDDETPMTGEADCTIADAEDVLLEVKDAGGKARVTITDRQITFEDVEG